MKNQLDKGKLWEKRRRDRLKESFHKLAQLLPQYDPARMPSQKDILDRATEFVKDLRLSNSRLLLSQTQADEKNKLIQELQDEVNRLILRVKQLTTLLKQANITIPTGPQIKSLGKRKLKWSEKLSPDDVENKKSRLSSKESSSSQSKDITKDSESANTGQAAPTPLRETNNDKPEKEVEILSPSSAEVSEEEASNSVPSEPSRPPPPPPPPLPPPPQPQVVQSIAPVQTLTFSLPVQTAPTTTIILTPQTIPVSPLLTRITMPAPRILPKPVDPTQLPKLPILRVTQPIIKVKRTRNRKKKVQIVVTKPAEPSPATPAAPADESNEEKGTDGKEKMPETAVAEAEKTVSEPQEPVTSTIEKAMESEPPVLSIPDTETSENDQPVIIQVTTEDSAVAAATAEDVAKEVTKEASKVAGEARPAVVEESIQTKSSEKVLPEVAEEQTKGPEKALSQVVEEPEKPPEAEEMQQAPQEVQEQTTCEKELEVRSLQPTESALEETVTQAESIETEQPRADNDTTANITSDTISQPENTSAEVGAPPPQENVPPPPKIAEPPTVPTTDPVVTTVNPEETPVAQPSVNLSESLQEIADLMQPPPAPPSKPDRIVEDSVVVTSDKISECIARSIDLIDQPEAELMELGADWGESHSHSPKSPISPTQMFLSMFPLLPRESLISSEQTNNPKQTFATSGGKSSSFYIDSMLPDDQSSSNGDNFPSSRSNTAILPPTSGASSSNLNTANLLSATPSVEPLSSITPSFSTADGGDNENSNPFSVLSISTPMRSALYPVTSSANSSASKTPCSRATDFDFVLSPYSNLLSNTYCQSSNISKDINWSPFHFSSTHTQPLATSTSTTNSKPVAQPTEPKRTEQPTATTDTTAPRKAKSAGKELSTYKPYASTGPTVREEAPPPPPPAPTQPPSAQSERANTPKRTKNTSKSQSPSRRQKDTTSLSTPQKPSVPEIYAPYHFHHHHQPYQASALPPPSSTVVPPAPAETPFAPYLQPPSVPDISSRLTKSCMGKEQESSRKRSSAAPSSTPATAASCPTPNIDFGGSSFYDNILPQSMHSQLTLGHVGNSSSSSKTQRHNQPFYLPDVPPLQNFDFMPHAIPPPPHQIFHTNKSNSSRTGSHQQINYFTSVPPPPVSVSHSGTTEFSYTNFSMMDSPSLYQQTAQQQSQGQPSQDPIISHEKKAGSGSAESSRTHNSSQQVMGSGASKQQQQNQLQAQRNIRGRSPAAHFQSNQRQYADSSQVPHQQQQNQAISGMRDSNSENQHKATAAGSSHREGQQNADRNQQQQSLTEKQAQKQREERSSTIPNPPRAIVTSSNDGHTQAGSTRERDHASNPTHNHQVHQLYNPMHQRSYEYSGHSQVQSHLQPHTSHHGGGMSEPRGHGHVTSQGNQHQQQQSLQSQHQQLHQQPQQQSNQPPPPQSHQQSQSSQRQQKTHQQQSQPHPHQQPPAQQHHHQQQQQQSRRGNNHKSEVQPYIQSQTQHSAHGHSQSLHNQQHQPQSHISGHNVSQNLNQQRIQQQQPQQPPLNHTHAQQRMSNQQNQGSQQQYHHQQVGSQSQGHQQSRRSSNNQQETTPSQPQEHQQQPTQHNQSTGPSTQSTVRPHQQHHVQLLPHTHNSNQQVPQTQPSSHNQQGQLYQQGSTAPPQQHHNSRPVNWMTDTQPSQPQQQQSSCTRKRTNNSNSIPNPFSVSKLVGNSSSTNNNQNSNNYCVEGLIRKSNNTSDWPDFTLSSLPYGHSQAAGSHVASFAPSYQASSQPDYTNYGNFTTHHPPSHHPQQHHNAHYPSGTPHPNRASRFDHFGHNVPPSHQHQQQVRHHASSGQNILPQQQQHSTTPGDNQSVQQGHQGSSILNFNLSSIFPEMNDKSRSNNNNSGNPTNNNVSSNAHNNTTGGCNFYPGISK